MQLPPSHPGFPPPQASQVRPAHPVITQQQQQPAPSATALASQTAAAATSDTGYVLLYLICPLRDIFGERIRIKITVKPDPFPIGLSSRSSESAADSAPANDLLGVGVSAPSAEEAARLSNAQKESMLHTAILERRIGQICTYSLYSTRD